MAPRYAVGGLLHRILSWNGGVVLAMTLIGGRPTTFDDGRPCDDPYRGTTVEKKNSRYWENGLRTKLIILYENLKPIRS
jgi:hypothetical protein